MARKFQYAFLLQLAQDRSDDAADVMRAAKARWDLSQQKLAQVQAYRDEYRNRFAASSQLGISVVQWRDFQLFLARLDAAVEAQAGEVQRCAEGFEQARLAWLEQQKQVKAFETLEMRHDQRLLALENKREQKQSDESAGKMYRQVQTQDR
ncbi:flagellar export protein FliJ [Parachitinimonas caeni]|uniref:Flagellar FliJ protein n=1 Tax=Parachitinimonas caeni TaxID=3031301 RepID=A0ABT7DYQ0_9NEIS|nr:flagellar export protein FliJ [Parachitinimonas caeni]MDK2123792.1 flagellar export protein FliJ [Parachitinimonas caeni]